MDTFQQALAEQVAEQHRHHGKALFFWVWGALLVMTAIEVYLTYQRMQPVKMLTILMGLSFIKAALIIGYFMHLKYERPGLFWSLIPYLIFVLLMIGHASGVVSTMPPHWRFMRTREKIGNSSMIAAAVCSMMCGPPRCV